MDKRTTGFRLAYTTEEFAAATGLTPRHVRVAIRRGEIPAVRVGKKYLIRAESFHAWAENQERLRARTRRGLRVAG